MEVGQSVTQDSQFLYTGSRFTCLEPRSNQSQYKTYGALVHSNSGVIMTVWRNHMLAHNKQGSRKENVSSSCWENKRNTCIRGSPSITKWWRTYVRLVRPFGDWQRMRVQKVEQTVTESITCLVSSWHITLIACCIITCQTVAYWLLTRLLFMNACYYDLSIRAELRSTSDTRFLRGTFCTAQ